ncbi:MAG: hypothetical protein QOI66_486 [Myxococcales bacterium]|jgi:hypothetical protein|nr:hypothetical protein [Myxococcales bacterium]
MNTSKRTRIIMTKFLLLGLAGGIFLAGCGPTFDPASLIDTTRVVGARVEVEGASDRTTPRPGETANITWLVTSREATPPQPLSWAFALCTPGTVGGKASLGCESTPLALFQGTASPPRIAAPVPTIAVLGSATSLILYGQICSGLDSTPTVDPLSGVPGCTGGGGTTASVSIRLQLGDETNHNPVADRAFTFDGQVWAPVAAGGDPCVVGPRVSAGTKDHVIGNTTQGIDRETYTAMLGDPAVATPVRETLQISQFTTAGELKSQFSFVDAADSNATTTVDVNWNAPKAADVPAAGLPVTFTFVVRDNRGGIDWTTRVACVGP